MIIVPKLSEFSSINGEKIDKIKPYIQNCLEIQMISEDYLLSLKNSCNFIEEYPNLNEVILHLPFSMYSIEIISSNLILREKFIAFIVECIKYSIEKNIKIYILFHLETTYEKFKKIGGDAFLEFCLGLVENTNVVLLVENSIIDVNSKEDLNINVLFKNDEWKKFSNLKMCLDLCHWQASKNITGEYLKLTNLLPYIYSIHFSATLNNDGYLNKDVTHSQKHPSIEACKTDLDLLYSYGVDIRTVKLVVEISETNYIERNDLFQELKYLEEISLNSYK